LVLGMVHQEQEEFKELMEFQATKASQVSKI
jgi:hypothetical protein